jgi:arylsulfatase A-like enzyme
LVAAALAGCGAGPDGGVAPRPNLVLILADDLGYRDLGIQGSPFALTPRIDSLARDGTRFTQAYVTAPLCAPTRAALLTGRDANRFGYTSITGSFRDQIRRDIGVPLSERLLSELLRDAGYATGVFGKWHLGVLPKYRPRARGFGSFFGYLAGAHAHLDWSGGLFGPVFRDDGPVLGKGHLTDAIAAEAAAFVTAQGDRPFFLYVPFGAVHTPFQASEADLAAVSDLPQESRVMAAMIRGLDRGVGRILDALRDAGVAENTLVVFLNDNGGVPLVSDNHPLRGGKGSLLEGGIRVPMLARWPAALAAGTVYDDPVSCLDLFPTFAAAAGVALPEALSLDGVDLLPQMTGVSEDPPHTRLFWRWLDQAAVREGSLKLVRYRLGTARESQEAPIRSGLYDLARDPGERVDLSDRLPETRRRLERLLASWIATLGPAEPYWDRGGETPVAR